MQVKVGGGRIVSDDGRGMVREGREILVKIVGTFEMRRMLGGMIMVVAGNI